MTSREHPTATITTPNSTPGQSGRFGSESVAAFVGMRTLNAPTPETATTTHFFYAHARLFKTDSAAMDEVYRRDFYRIFMEDVAIVEAQQASLDRNAAAERIDINVDAPGLAMRALLREHIAAEAAAGDNSRPGA